MSPQLMYVQTTKYLKSFPLTYKLTNVISVKVQTLILSKSDTQNSAMSNIANFKSCSFMKLIYKKFSCISVLSQAELGMQVKTQLHGDQNCVFAEWNELDIKSAMFDMAILSSRFLEH